MSQPKVINTITVGKGPLCNYSDGTYVWVANATLLDTDPSVSQIDIQNNNKVYTYTSAVYGFIIPESVYSDKTYLWVYNVDTDDIPFVIQIQISTKALIRKIDLNYSITGGSGGGFTGNAVTSDGTNTWALDGPNSGKGTITRINISSGVPTNIPILDDSYTTAICSDSTYVWVVSVTIGESSIVTKLDHSGAILSSISLGSNSAKAVNICVDDKYVWVSNTELNYLFQIDKITNIVTPISLPIAPLIISTDGDYVWISNLKYKNSVFQFDIMSKLIINTIPVGPSDILHASISSDGQYVWVANTFIYDDNAEVIGAGNTVSQIEINPKPISNICFAAGTPVQTDQGIIPIEKINKDINTINQKRIVAVTQTVSLNDSLISVEKNAFGASKPSKRTVMSQQHKILYNGEMREAIDIYTNVFQSDEVMMKKVPYNGDILYNILLKEHGSMTVNNLVVETLHPQNFIATLYMQLNRMNMSNASHIRMKNRMIHKYNDVVRRKTVDVLWS